MTLFEVIDTEEPQYHLKKPQNKAVIKRIGPNEGGY